MTKMLEGLKTIYSGNNIVNKQIQLFSLCGIVAILGGYLSLAIQGINEIKPIDKAAIVLCQIIWILFFTGYETIYIHRISLPELDMSSFKIALKKIPLIIFFVFTGLALISTYFTSYQYFALSLEIILGVPLTMLQAGYALNYNADDYKKYFQKFRVKEYFYLLIKRIWIIFCAYLTAFMTTFLIFFTIGIILAIVTVARGSDLASMVMLITSNQTVLAKLSTYVSNILLVYFLSVGVLVWDYELIKTYESEE